MHTIPTRLSLCLSPLRQFLHCQYAKPVLSFCVLAGMQKKTLRSNNGGMLE